MSSTSTLAPARSVDAFAAAGYRSAKSLTLAHAKSFSLASAVLFGARRRAAFGIYAFCRRLDDLVDEGDTAPAALKQRLDRAHEVIHGVFAAAGATDAWPRLAAGTPWPAEELAAFADTVARYRLTEEPFHDLVLGMAMDLAKSTYASWEELDLYCYRVAGTVGLMMAPVLGCSAAWALGPAAALGRAMQLTNILRDVREDLARGRLYLPQDELSACGVTLAQLRAGHVGVGWRRFLRLQIARARELYSGADAGLPALGRFGPRALVRLMRALYGGILEEIERADFDVFSRRLYVPPRRKAWLAATALLGLSRAPRGGAQVARALHVVDAADAPPLPARSPSP